jgi:trimeric autotransporter adhesin
LRLDFLPILIACFALSSTAQAVGPDTGGAIPGANNGEGIGALVSLTSGGWNTGTGYLSLRNNTTGSFNTATGGGSLFFNADGERNTATGAGALFHNTDGTDNTATGAFALFDNIRIGDVVGYSNTATGVEALGSNLSGYENTATGVNALVGNTYGIRNTATGVEALFSNVNGSYNTADGYRALHNHVGALGGYNTAIGAGTLYNDTSGGGNVALGFNAGLNVTTANNVICIGTGIQGANVTGTCFIGNIFGVQTGLPDALPVVVDANGQLGTVASSRRFKKEIKPMDRASESILALKPVTFHYKTDTKGMQQFGLVAEDVEKINPDLVVRDKEGKPYSVRYEQVNAMLLNEFLKEHRQVEQLRKDFESKLAAQQDQIEALTASLQKVSAQIQMSKVAPKVARNNQ